MQKTKKANQSVKQQQNNPLLCMYQYTAQLFIYPEFLPSGLLRLVYNNCVVSVHKLCLSVEAVRFTLSVCDSCHW